MEYGKIPPQAVDLEEAVLGAMMLEQQAVNKVIDILKPDMFYKEAHQYIFKAIFKLFEESEPVDILTVNQRLKKEGELEIVGGAYYIMQLTNRIASGANAEFHARIIQQKYIQRELIRISSDIIKDAFEETTDVLELLDKAEKNLFTVAENNLRKSAMNMADVVKEAIKNIEEAAKQEGNISGIATGFHHLDNLTSGWQPADLIILAARPGMGKTAFVLSLARNVAVDYKKSVALFSLEMSSVQLVTRLISSESEISADKLKKGNLTDKEWVDLNKSIGSLNDAKIFIDDTPALSIFELRAKSRRLKSKENIEVIIIDYLQLMTAGSDKAGNREQEISMISRGLKALAKELELPIITLSQLNRSVETRGGDKKPQLSDLRESGAIEQDADMVCFLYRPGYYNITEGPDGEAFPEGYTELIVAKHRNGALDDVKLTFLGQFAKFTNAVSGFGAEEYINAASGNMEPSTGMVPNSNFDVETTTVTLGSKMNNASSDENGVPF
ncbi:MAG: replicative DNA helicase [Bacteroidales bacterium]|nr:replicative DNA helicase [Bacteroidales bacterium]